MTARTRTRTPEEQETLRKVWALIPGQDLATMEVNNNEVVVHCLACAKDLGRAYTLNAAVLLWYDHLCDEDRRKPKPLNTTP